MFRFPLRLKLLNSGLLVIGFTLICQLIFMTVLAWQLSDADRQLWLQLHEYHCVAAGNKVIELFYRASRDLARFAILRDPSSLKKYERHAEQVKVAGEYTWTLMETHPEASPAVVKEACVLSDKALTTLSEVRRAFELEPDSVVDRGRVVQRTTDILSSYFEVLGDVVRGEQKVRHRLQIKKRVRHQSVTSVILVGILLSAGLAVAIVFIWIQGVTKRIDHLMENSRRLGRGEALLPYSGINDEIAQLSSGLFAAAKQLHESDQARQEMVAVASHELRSPLSAISATLVLAREGVYGPLNRLGRERLKEAEIDTKRLLNTLNELLDVHKLESGKIELQIENVDMMEILEVAVDEISAFATGRGVRLGARKPSFMVEVDPTRIGQVLIKIASYIVLHSPSNSLLRIETFEKGRHIEIEIANPDSSLTTEQLLSMFERYESDEQLDPESKFGFILARGIIEEHGGTYGVKEGSCVWLRLPTRRGN